MARVTEINDLNALASYRMTWNALLGDTPRSSFFHTYDWLVSYWRHFGEGHRLRVLVVEAAGKPVGIVPLVVRTEKRHFGTVRVLSYPLEGWGSWYSPIGGAQAATLRLAMRHIVSTPRDWDLFDLSWVDHERTDRGRTAGAFNAVGLPCKAEATETNSVIDVAGDWESFLAGLSSKARHEVRRTIQRVEELGEVEYVRYRPEPLRDGGGEPAWNLYDECEEVARDSWQAGLEEGNTLSHERYRPFLREAHESAARLGMLDLNLLRVNGKAQAFNYNYIYHGTVFGLRMGYRASSSYSGVGAGLMLMTLRDSFARGDTSFEMGAGDQPYKRRLRTRAEQSWRLTHAPLTSWRSQAVRLSRWMRARRGEQPAVGKAAAK